MRMPCWLVNRLMMVTHFQKASRQNKSIERVVNFSLTVQYRVNCYTWLFEQQGLLNNILDHVKHSVA